MKKVNIEELTRSLNEFRMSNVNKTFTRQEIGEKLVELGFNPTICGALIPKLLPYEKLGTSRLYSMPKDPIHKNQVESCYKMVRNYKVASHHKKSTIENKKTPIDNFTEAKEVNDAIHLLLSRGYKVYRPLGLDVKALLADHPELESKYMRYANI